MAVSRWAGRGRCRQGHGRSFGVRVPVGDRGGGGCTVVAGPSPGSGHRGHPCRPRNAAGPDVVDGHPPPGCTGSRWIRSDRSRHRRGLCGERGGEARRGRGAPLSCVTRGGRPCRGVPRGGRLVVSEQPRNPGRRIGGRSGRAVAPSRRDHAAVGRGRRAAARAGGSPLPARCARRRAPRRHRGGGPAARVHALCPMGGITAGKTAEERSRPHGPRPRQRPGCPRPASPGWNSRGL